MIAPLLNEKELSDCLNSISDTSVVITFVNYEYLEIFKMFYGFWRKHNNTNLLVVCLDEQSSSFMKEYGIRHILYKYFVKNRYKFWRVRLALINQIFLLAKRTLIHTDSDCFWIKNILPLITENTVEAFYSTGKGHPKHVAKQLGFVLCCGLFAVNYTPATLNYFNTLLHQEMDTDDQIATNEWVFNNKKQIVNDPVNSICDKKILINNLSIACISRTAVMRWNARTTTSPQKCFCVHPYLTGTITEKIDRARVITRLLLTNVSP
jgi:hypothetical protein